MTVQPPTWGRLPHAYLTPGSSSFAQFLGGQAPELLPGHQAAALTNSNGRQ